MSQPRSPIPVVSWMYDTILSILSLAVHLFFRDVQVRGAWRIPATGSVILVAAPHSNQFVDSVILMRILRSLNRQISWLMAEKSFRRKFVGGLAAKMGVVPVSRAMDIAKAVEGTIYIPDPVLKPKNLRGNGTNFMGPEFKAGGSIYLPILNGDSQKLDIAELVGPEELVLRNAPENSDALFQLTGNRDVANGRVPGFKGTKFKVAPHVDQAQVYSAVFEKLRADGCVGIFPEGASHDRTELLPLKAGVAIIALGALAKDIPLTIVPVGLTYFSAHKFRSRAVIEFGDPVTLEPTLIKEFKEGRKGVPISTLMIETEKALKSVTVSAPDFETLQLIHAARRLYLTRTPYNDKTLKISLANTTELNRRLSKGYTTYSQTPEMISFTKKLKSYTASLRALGLKDHQLLSMASQHNHFSLLFILPKILYRLFKLSVLAILTLPGLVLFAPVFVLTRRMSHRKTAEALAASSLKIKGHDVMATWKIMIALVLAPLFYAWYSIVLVVLHKHDLTHNLIPSSTSTSTIILLSWLILPGMTYASLIFGEQGMDILKSLYPLFLSLDGKSSRMVERLREERRVLVGLVREIVDTYGQDIFPDCGDVRKWRGRGPRRLYADVSPETEMEDLLGLNEFV